MIHTKFDIEREKKKGKYYLGGSVQMVQGAFHNSQKSSIRDFFWEVSQKILLREVESVNHDSVILAIFKHKDFCNPFSNAIFVV